ncbi:MAG: hypothetical protein R3Y63_01895 [Eubacteriales bacterium]
MQFGSMVKKGQLQVSKKVNFVTLSSYNTTLMLHALCRIEEKFVGKFKYDTNLAGYDDSLGVITIFVDSPHHLTEILTLIDTCEPINGKLLATDLDFTATVTNHPDHTESYQTIPPAEPANPFIRGWRGLSVEDKKEFIKAFELLDKGMVSDLISIKAGITASLGDGARPELNSPSQKNEGKKDADKKKN